MKACKVLAILRSLLLVGGMSLSSVGALAQAGGALQTQETNVQGVSAELIECSRKAGVLTVKLRFRASAEKKTWFNIDTGHGAYAGFYVVAGDKKHFILRDAEGAPIAPKALGGVHLNKGETHLWWAKFPAPGIEVKQVKLVLPEVLPFEDIPVTDK
ncbi:hypothetical protein BURK2_03218 [Burkholderiales bacterium]|nr:MAG: hypothetical protein F9K47_18345 [Burkholderiales bacterium]CAG1003473.1 hypothetical protein BURK2_03218 [Burkholderiales bacterium]